MAQTTVELRHLLKLSNFELFDFEYQFDDQNMKKEIEQKIIDYYYFSEIGQETPDRFKHVFKTRFMRAIGYYNKLHNTTLLEYNPLINYKMSEALEQLSKSNTSTNTNSNTTSRGTTESDSHDDIEQTTDSETNRSEHQNSASDSTRTDNTTQKTNTDEQMSDYPQQPIAGGDFLSGARQSDTNTTNTGTVKNNANNENTITGTSSDSTINNTQALRKNTTTSDDSIGVIGKQIDEGTENTSYEKTIEGLTGMTYQDLITKERENLIRIPSMIIEELKPCFMLTY